MKHFHYMLMLVFYFSTAAKATAREFVMDCGLREPFIGQKFICHFILYSEEDFVDVEVIKFPEFRGFWSENVAMRQGPIGLLALPTPQGVRKQAVIGSYAISQMYGRSNSQIIPMKISVAQRVLGERSQVNPTEESEMMISKSLPITSIPLPSIPKTFQSDSFFGLVGEFSVPQSNLIVNYRLNEPTNLKISVEGRGNFPELNSLPIRLPPDSEIVSQHSFLQNMGETSVKTFEYSILLKSSPPSIHSLGAFLYFNPQAKSYQMSRLPEARFVLAPPIDRDEVQRFQLPQPELHWTIASNPLRSMAFWVSQILLVLTALGISLSQQLRRLTSLRTSSPAFQREQRWMSARQAKDNGEPQKALELANSIFSELLKEKAVKMNSTPDVYPTQKKLIQMCDQLFPKDRIQRIRELFKAYEQSFNPTPTEPRPKIDLLRLESDLTEINKNK